MADKIIHEFDKNSSETIRLSLTEFRGKDLVNFRVYYQDDDGEFKPSKKGISFSQELVDDFFEAVDKLKAELK